MYPDSIELVNAVGGGDFGVELDLDVLQNSLDVYEPVYDPEYHPALKIKLNPDSATILIFGTGKYNIAGAESIKELWKTNDRIRNELRSALHNREISCNNEFEIRNLVLLIETSFEFDLNELATQLGTEETSYEPEQSPHLMYNPDYTEGVFMLFRTGKVILTGEVDLNSANSSIEQLYNELPY